MVQYQTRQTKKNFSKNDSVKYIEIENVKYSDSESFQSNKASGEVNTWRSCSYCFCLAFIPALLLILNKLIYDIINADEYLIRDGDNACDSGKCVIILKNQQVRRFCTTEGMTMLMKIALIAKALPALNRTLLPNERLVPYLSRPAVNFLFNTSSTQGSGLLWTKRDEFSTSSFNTTSNEIPNGGVVIPHTDLFVVYSSFTLENGNRKRCCEKKDIHHKLFRRNIDNNSKANESVIFHKKTSMGSENQEIQTNSFFDILFLQKGDQIYPWLSNVSTVYRMSVASNWGLFAFGVQ